MAKGMIETTYQNIKPSRDSSVITNFIVVIRRVRHTEKHG